MFHIMRRIFAGLPFAFAAIGLSGQPTLLVVPPALTAGFVLLRDRSIRRHVGHSAWPSDGFACHVLVDDLARLLCLTMLGIPVFLAFYSLRGLLGSI